MRRLIAFPPGLPIPTGVIRTPFAVPFYSLAKVVVPLKRICLTYVLYVRTVKVVNLVVRIRREAQEGRKRGVVLPGVVPAARYFRPVKEVSTHLISLESPSGGYY